MNSTDQSPSVTPATVPIQQDPEKLGGQPTIGGQRIQAATLIDYFADGLSLQDFYQDFPSVTEEEAQSVLAVIKKAIATGMLTGIQISDEDIV